MNLPLNALRAFEVSARYLSFTRAAEELHLTQAAVSQHVKNLEERLGKKLFRRVHNGLVLTDEGLALVPVLAKSFERIEATLETFQTSPQKEVLSVGIVGTFAAGWLLPRLRDFQHHHPFVELRLFTNNNRVDLSGEGLDFAIRFGDGLWHGTEASHLLCAPLAALCSPMLASRIQDARDLQRETLLRSYRMDEWPAWFKQAGLEPPLLTGPVFDSSLLMADAAADGLGVALLPLCMFNRQLRSGRLIRLFEAQIELGSYWLTRLKTRKESHAMEVFRDWLERGCHSPSRDWS